MSVRLTVAVQLGGNGHGYARETQQLKMLRAEIVSVDMDISEDDAILFKAPPDEYPPWPVYAQTS